MCWESRDIFLCGCEKQKHQARPELCPWALAKGSACPSFQCQVSLSTSNRFSFPCLGCTRFVATTRARVEKRRASGWRVLMGYLR